ERGGTGRWRDDRPGKLARTWPISVVGLAFGEDGGRDRLAADASARAGRLAGERRINLHRARAAPDRAARGAGARGGRRSACPRAGSAAGSPCRGAATGAGAAERDHRGVFGGRSAGGDLQQVLHREVGQGASSSAASSSTYFR